jgi:RHS repeat-associated protein
VLFLSHDHLGSVRAITNPAGARGEATVYKPYGERGTTVVSLQPESKGGLGERFDPETGLQYLNARYYDPELGISFQPDWFEVTQCGVGTKRYAYAFGDLVNKMEPGGCCARFFAAAAWLAIGADGLCLCRRGEW